MDLWAVGEGGSGMNGLVGSGGGREWDEWRAASTDIHCRGKMDSW